MIDPRERVLEVSLAEELSGAAPPDLSLRILLAARKGRLTALPPGRASLAWRVAAAAALLLAVAAGGLWLKLHPPRPAATGSVRLRVIAEDGAERWDDRFFEGEWVVASAEDGAIVTLDAGGDVTLSPRTALCLSHVRGARASLRLAAGRMTVRVPEKTRLTVSPQGGLPFSVEGTATFEAAVDPWMTVEEFPDSARSLARGFPDLFPVFIDVETGSVSLAGVNSWQAGESLWLRADGSAVTGHLPPPETRRRVDVLIAAARRGEADFGGSGPDLFVEMKKAEQAGEDLVKFLAADPATWDYAVPRLSVLPDASRRSDVRARLLRLLTWEPGRRSEALLTRALAEEPDTFDPDTVMRLAERGLAPATERLAASVAGADAPELRVLPAAFFAFRGDARGREALVPAEASGEFLRSRPLDWLAAAAGLAAIDGAERWRESMRRLGAVLAPALDAGQTEYVRWFALAALYFAPAARERKPVTLARLGYAVEDSIAPRNAEFRTSAEIRALLLSLAD